LQQLFPALFVDQSHRTFVNPESGDIFVARVDDDIDEGIANSIDHCRLLCPPRSF